MRWNIIFKLTFRQLIIPLAGIACGNVYAALDPPHDTAGCLSCHNMTSTETNLLPPLGHPPTSIDETPANTTCEKCHLTGELGIPIVSTTHSSVNTGEDYGEWTVECSVCHNQHLQEQEDNGSTYGKFIRRAVNLANIKGGDGNTLGKTGIKPVKFTGSTGPNSFADGDATYNGICEVCHDQTDHYQGDGTGTDQNHAYVAKLAAKNANLNNTHQNCVACHPHQNGFRPSCPDCHGFPPTNNTPGDRNGLVGTPAPTGSTTNGQHALHATSAGYNYPCHTCHYGGMTMTMTADDVNADQQIQIGFSAEYSNASTIPAYTVYRADTSTTKCYVGVTRNCGLNINGTGQQIAPLQIEQFVAANLGSTTADGSGTVYYDGENTLSGTMYVGSNNTTINPGDLTHDKKQCSSVYCHTDGKRALVDSTMYAPENYPPRYKIGNISPPWDDAGYDPQNDSFKCNNCHDYPPRYDSHRFHASRPSMGLNMCSICHFGVVNDNNPSIPTDDTILDRTLHANGRIDVISGPQFYYQSSWHPQDIAYIPKPGGGTCINRCHSYINFTDPKAWINKPIPAEVPTSVTWSANGSQQCATPGLIGRVMNFNISTACPDCVPPYDLSIDWGDGNATTSTTSATNFTHTYLYDISALPYPDRAYDVTWSLEDSEGIPGAAPNPRTTRLVVCPQANTAPAFSWTYAADPSVAHYDLTVTVTARDPDYNVGSHSGPAKIKIDWGGWPEGGGPQADTIIEADLTDVDQQFSATFNYSTSGYYYVDVAIDDNAPESGYTPISRRVLYVRNNQVTCQAGTPSPPGCP